MYVQCGINVGPNTDNLKLAAWYNLALELDEGPVIEVQSQRVGDVSVTAAKGPLKSLISVIENLGTEPVQSPQPVETAPVQAAPAAEQTQTAPAAEQTQSAPASEPMQTAPAPARRGRPPGRKSTATAAEQTAALSATAQPAAPAQPAEPVEVPAPVPAQPAQPVEVPAQPAQPTQALPPGIAIPPGMTTTQPQQPAMPKVPVGANGSNGVDGATTIEDLRACILQVNQRDQEMNRKPNTAFNLMRRKHWEDGTPHPAWFTADTVPVDCYDRLIEELGLAATV